MELGHPCVNEVRRALKKDLEPQKLEEPFLGLTIIRTIVYLGLYWASDF